MATSGRRLLQLTAEDPEDKQKLLDGKARDSLQVCHEALCSRMNPDGVRRNLFFYCNVLTANENEEAQRPDLIKSKRSESLVDFVRQRGWRGIINFAAVLIATHQEDLAEYLVQALEQKLEEHSIDVRDEVDQAKMKMFKLHQKVSPVHDKPDYTYYLAKLDDEHADLQEAVYNVLRQADSKQLSTRLISLLTSYKDRAPAGEDIDSAIKNIQKCFKPEGHPENVFMFFTPFLDKLDVRLLEGLIKFASKENSSSAKYAKEQKIDLDQQLNEYKSKVASACDMTLKLCPRQPASKQPKNQLIVGMQTFLPEHDVTIAKVLRLKKFFCDHLGMKEAVFEGFSCSNVTLFFSVSKNCLPFLVHWCFLHRRDLMEKFGVELVFSPGHFVGSLYADQEYWYPPTDPSQPQPAVLEKEPVGVLSEMNENLTATLQDTIWNWQTAFEKKNDKWRAELHGKIGNVQKAILSVSVRECKVPEETGGLAKELRKQIEEYKWKLENTETELVSTAAQLQKCRDELRTTTCERDRLSRIVVLQDYINKLLTWHRLQEQMTKNLDADLFQFTVANIKASTHKIHAVVSELMIEAGQQSQNQTNSTLSVQQSLNGPASVSKAFAEVGSLTEEMLSLNRSQSSSLRRQSSTGAPHAPIKGLDSHARTTEQTVRTPLLQRPAEFTVEKFMNGCKVRFLKSVRAKVISAELETDDLISSVEKKDIDGAADAYDGALILFKHFIKQGRPVSIPHLFNIMEKKVGNPSMIKFAKDMKKELNKYPLTDFEQI